MRLLVDDRRSRAWTSPRRDQACPGPRPHEREPGARESVPRRVELAGIDELAPVAERVAPVELEGDPPLAADGRPRSCRSPNRRPRPSPGPPAGAARTARTRPRGPRNPRTRRSPAGRRAHARARRSSPVSGIDMRPDATRAAWNRAGPRRVAAVAPVEQVGDRVDVRVERIRLQPCRVTELNHGRAVEVGRQRRTVPAAARDRQRQRQSGECQRASHSTQGYGRRDSLSISLVCPA